MAHNKGGNGGGKSKCISAEDHEIARKAAKAKKRRSGGRGMHAATYTGSKLENDRLMTVDLQREALEMALAACEEYATHQFVNGSTVRARYTAQTLEDMKLLLCLLFDDDTAENRRAITNSQIISEARQNVYMFFVIASEVHGLRKIFCRQFNWYPSCLEERIVTQAIHYHRATRIWAA